MDEPGLSMRSSLAVWSGFIFAVVLSALALGRLAADDGTGSALTLFLFFFPLVIFLLCHIVTQLSRRLLDLQHEIERLEARLPEQQREPTPPFGLH